MLCNSLTPPSLAIRTSTPLRGAHEQRDANINGTRISGSAAATRRAGRVAKIRLAVALARLLGCTESYRPGQPAEIGQDDPPVDLAGSLRPGRSARGLAGRARARLGRF